MKVLLISDCHSAHICGVTRKQREVMIHLRLQNHIPMLIQSDLFWNMSPPYFKDVRVTIPSPVSYLRLVTMIESFNPDYIHIFTEGTLGLMSSIHCTLVGRAYTTMRTTQFENYVHNWFLHKCIQGYLESFHSFSKVCITPSPSLAKLYKHPSCVSILNGCNTSDFKAEGTIDFSISSLPRPLWLYVGRVSVEKNIDEFINLTDKLPGTFIVVGDGPYLKHLPQKNNLYYLGWKTGKELSAIYRTCDVFVFPSKTDTFGQVMVEAMSSGLPVAAYPVIGPIDVVSDGVSGCLDEDLHKACLQAYEMKDSQKCITHASTFSWSTMCTQFLECQVLSRPTRPYIYSSLGFGVFVLVVTFLS